MEIQAKWKRGHVRHDPLKKPIIYSLFFLNPSDYHA